MRIFLSLLLSGFILFACTKKEENTPDTAALGKFSPYISSINSGIISKTDPFIITFNKTFDDVSVGAAVDNDLFSISPKVEVEAIWKSQSTIELRPKEHLESDKTYQVSIQLDELFTLEEDFPERFSFSVQTIPLSYAVSFENLVNADPSDFTKINYTGQIETSDWVENAKVEKMLSASFQGEAMEISFQHDAEQKHHQFTIKGIRRQPKDTKLNVSWEGSPIGISDEGSTELEIPSKDKFKVLSAAVERDGAPYIHLVFSDPIDKNQNFEDAIQLGTELIRFSADKNKLKIYTLAGSQFDSKINLKILKNLKNAKGLSLDEAANFTLRVSTYKPQVKLNAAEGHIMPASSKLLLPLSVVGLKAVEVTVIQLFPNNIHQYFQNNKLGNDYYLDRVGRPIIRKTIPLIKAGITDYYNWNNVSLDLAELFKTEKGAIYQVKVSFTKEMAVYNCQGMDPEEQIEEQRIAGDQLSWDDLRKVYYGRYDWDERDNPCHEMYYRRNRGVEKMLMASDIGLTAKVGENNSIHLLTTDLISSNSLANVNLKVYDYQNQLLVQGKTDEQGMLQLNVPRKPFLAVAEKEGQYAYLKLSDGESLSLSNFDVSGATAEEGLKGFIYGERGVWRPGDTLHLAFMLEDQFQKIEPATPVFMELFNPQGQLVQTFKPQSIEKPIYYFEPHTLKEAPTGNWLCKVTAGGAVFTKNLKIETVKPNRLKIDLSFGSELLKSNEGNYASLEVRWLHGAVARNLEAKFEMSVWPTDTKFDNYLGYEFDDPAKEYYSAKKVVFENRIDNQGKASFPIKVKNSDQAPGMLRLWFSGKVFEEGGDFSISNSSKTYSPYSSYAGLKVPNASDYSNNPVLYTEKDNRVEVVSLGEEEQAAPNTKMQIELYELDWRWWWDHGQENISNYVSRSYNRPVSSQYVRTDSEGKAFFNLRRTNDQWGRYYLRVTNEASGHSTGKIVYFRRSDWYGSMAKSLGGASMLNFNLSKKEAQVGEKVQVQIPGAKGGHAYISIESGKAVLEEYFIALEESETIFELEIKENMAPNVYVHVSVIQPHNHENNDLPIRLYGIRGISVENKNTVLKPVISVPANAQPTETITIEVSEEDGKAMAYTIALVDEGLLGLTNYKTPKPWEHFFAKEALGVKTWDVYDAVMGAYAGYYGKLLAIGGDEAGSLEEKSESRFKPVVGYLGPFSLDENERKTHTYQIPQYIGELRTMVVAAHSSGKYGSEQKSIGINQPLMMLATLPRVMGPGEETKMPVTVFAKDPSITKARIQVKAAGQLKHVGKSYYDVNINKDKETIVYVPIKAVNALGKGSVSIEAVSGKHKAVYDVNMQVRPSNPMMVSTAEKFIEGGKSWDTTYKPLGMVNTNEATIEISSLPPLNLEQRTDYLIRYPHGCVEQTTSSVFAQLYLPDLLELSSKRQLEIQNNVEAAISRHRNFQTSSGGFAYWPGSLTPSEWGTNYAGHFLLEAKAKGYKVPNDLLRNFKRYQTRLANEWTMNSNGYRRSDLIQAYRLYTLALAGSPAMSAMNRMREINSLSVQAKWMLANAYATADYVDVAIALIESTSTDIDNYRELAGTYGSAVRDEAIIMHSLINMGLKSEAFKMLQKIAVPLGDSKKWMSTQTTAYCLIAIAAYAQDFPANSTLNASVKIGSETQEIERPGYFAQLVLGNPDAQESIQLMNEGDEPLYARLIRQGIPLEGGELAENTNIDIRVQYYDTDDQPIQAEKIPQGTDFKAIVTVSNPGSRGDLEQLALTHIFPSGWEILNARLNGNQKKDETIDYKDIRDDRVLTYFNLQAGKKKRFEVNLNASYQGKYYLPAVQVEAMYDNSIYASVRGKWISVIQ